ncbi:hypothetical protein GCM10028857_23820 [Salinarchaeum chitinilyticum]
MGGKRTEACGRCSVTTVIDAKEAVDGEEGPGSSDGGESGADAAGADTAATAGQNPFDGERIELSERELTSVVRHEVAIGKLRAKLDSFASRLIYGA